MRKKIFNKNWFKKSYNDLLKYYGEKEDFKRAFADLKNIIDLYLSDR